MRGGAPSEAERGRAVLSLGILAFRWVSLGWMVVLALTAGELRRPALAVAMIAVLGAWTGWLTVARPRPTWPVLVADLGLAVALNLVAGLVMPADSVGERPYFAAGYPVAAAVTWGAARGVGGGVAAGLVLGVSLAAGQLVNGIDLAGEEPAVLLDLAGGTLNFVLAGGAVGLVARLLERSAGQLQAATEETIRARERAARLAERESLARQIHDSVLQALALVHKRGRELAAGGPVPPDQVAGLAEMAAGQERALRSLILRDPEDEHAAGRRPAPPRSGPRWRRWPGPSGPCRSPPGPPAPCGCRRGRSRSCPRPSARPSTTWSSTPAPPGWPCSPRRTAGRSCSPSATTAAGSPTTSGGCSPRARSAWPRASRAGSSSSAAACW